jgi:hypothetical protein
MILVDPADNTPEGIRDDVKNEAEAKLKIDNIYQQLQGKATLLRSLELRVRTSIQSQRAAILAGPQKRT